MGLLAAPGWCLTCCTVRPTATIGADRAQAATAGYLAELHDIAAAGGITRTAVSPRRRCCCGRGASCTAAPAAGLADDMAFTYRNPERSTDPPAAVAGAQAIFVGARPYGAARRPPGPAGSSGRIARYAWDDHVDRAARGAVGRRPAAARRRVEGRGVRRRQRIVDREVAHLAGIGWFGKNANLLLPGAGSWFVLGCVVTTAPLPVATGRRSPTAAARAARCLDGCPTGAIVAPGVVDAGRCLAWLLQKPGVDPAAVPRGARRPDLRLRRLPGRRARRRCGSVAAAGRRTSSRRRRASTSLALLAPPTTRCSTAGGRWYLADRDPRWLRRNALVVLGNIGDGRRPRGRAVLARYLAVRADAARPRRVGGAPARARRHLDARAADADAAVPTSSARSARPMKHLLVTNDFPPKIGGIQSLLWEWWRRLPPESFAVLTSPYAGAAEFDRRPAVPHRAGPRAGAAAAPVDGAPHRRDGRPRSAPTSSCSTRRCRSGSSARRCDLPYDVVLHGAEVTVPGRLPGQPARCSATCCAAPATSSPAGGYPAAEAERAAGRPLPSRSSRPASTPTASSRSTTAERRAARERFGLPADAELVVGSAGSCRARASTRRSAPRRRCAAPRPDLVLAIAGGGRDERRLRRLAERAASAPVRFLGRVPNDDLPGAVRLRRRLRHAVPQPVGRPRAGGLRHRVPRGRGVWRAAGGRRLRRGGRGRRRRRDRHRRAPPGGPARGRRGVRPRLLDDPAAARRDGRRRPRRGPSPSSPTTCSPSGWVAALGALP